MQALIDLLRLARLTQVVDVGANPIDGDPPYKALMLSGGCAVLGFEPQAKALEQLLRAKGPNERYLPQALGDGAIHTLHVCRAPGMTSLFPPDPSTLGLFDILKPAGDVFEELSIQTTRLDDIPDIENLDFLKMDVQGAELMVLQNGRNKLNNAVVAQLEVSFVTLYQNQPAFGEVDTEMRAQGFIPHCFAAVKQWPISPCVIGGDPRKPLNQLLEADLVYVRDFSKPDNLSDEQLKHLALVVHVCYGSWDLAMRCITMLERRGALPAGAQNQYVSLFGAKPQ